MGLKVSINKAFELTKGEVKVLEKLKGLYAGVKHEVYVYGQQSISSKRVDFIVIDAKRGIAILEVKDWSEDYIKSVNKMQVQLLDKICDNPVRQVKGYKNNLSSVIFNRNFDSISEEDISTVIIFTNIDKSIKNNSKYTLLIKSDVKYLFKDDVSTFGLEQIFGKENLEYTLNDMQKIRVALFPEIEIVAIEDEKGEDNIDIKALDFEQEDFAKRIPIGNYMVTGIPGSGKTVILFARAIHLIKENPDWRVLILTYNKSLRYKLQSKLNKVASLFSEDLNNKDINIDNIEIRHFHGETNRLSNGARKPYNMRNDEWFNEEIVRIASANARPEYDAILIDEYQDFRMSWISLCVKLCKEYTLDKSGKKVKNLFLAGDRLQSIYNNKDVSWKSIGLDMRGRSKLLKTSYRSANEHMALALNFLRNDKKLRDEVDKFYKDDESDNTLSSVSNGSVKTITGNFSMIGDKIIELKKIGYKNEDFLILAGTRSLCEEIKNSCSERIRYEMQYVWDLDSNNIRDNIVVTTYHSSKGLEAKVVFLTTIDSIYNGNDIENQMKRKTVYVGMTRASEKLYIHSRLNKSGELSREIRNLL